MTRPLNPICLALDTPDPARAVELVRRLKQSIGFVKIGMELFYGGGPQGYEAVAGQGVPVFLDLKLNDIPNTVASALRSLMQLAPRPAIVNVHAAGGSDMLKAAAGAVEGCAKLIAVTVLTSLSNEDLWAIGFDRGKDAGEHAVALARLAASAGLDGVVCSSREVARVKSTISKDFLAVVPGIRPAEAASHDQKRIATPREALRSGADLLVIGRAITAATDPARAADEIAASIERIDAV
jgi:orotidine-5'-phosphate decarboxylase